MKASHIINSLLLVLLVQCMQILQNIEIANKKVNLICLQ